MLINIENALFTNSWFTVTRAYECKPKTVGCSVLYKETKSQLFLVNTPTVVGVPPLSRSNDSELNLLEVGVCTWFHSFDSKVKGA